MWVMYNSTKLLEPVIYISTQYSKWFLPSNETVTDTMEPYRHEEVCLKHLGHGYNTSCVCSLEQKVSVYNIKLVKYNIFCLYNT